MYTENLTVKKAVARYILRKWDHGKRYFTGWEIETAHPDHQLTGLRKLRKLAEEYSPDWYAYFYDSESKKYQFWDGFIFWLREHYGK